jgi:hypothetical protein
MVARLQPLKPLLSLRALLKVRLETAAGPVQAIVNIRDPLREFQLVHGTHFGNIQAVDGFTPPPEPLLRV